VRSAHLQDLHCHDLWHEGACRLLADGVDIGVVQLILGHSDIKTTPRYLNITDEELRKTLTGVWEHQRQLKADSGQASVSGVGVTH
jgi:site-specific recombinase XerD